MSLHAPDFTTLLTEGARHVRGGWTATVRVVPGPELLLPTGRLVACEPRVPAGDEADELAFRQRVDPGRYRVELLVADLFDETGTAVDAVNAAARVVVRDEPVATWCPALCDGRDEADLDDDPFYGYPVDGGLGGFASPEALVALGDAGDLDDDSPIQAGPTLSAHAAEAFNKIAAAVRDDDGSMDPSEAQALRRMVAAARQIANRSRPSGPGHVGVRTDRATGTNILSFRCGAGDGHCGTWVGYTASGAVACFLTDFAILTG